MRLILQLDAAAAFVPWTWRVGLRRGTRTVATPQRRWPRRCPPAVSAAVVRPCCCCCCCCCSVLLLLPCFTGPPPCTEETLPLAASLGLWCAVEKKGEMRRMLAWCAYAWGGRGGAHGVRAPCPPTNASTACAFHPSLGRGRAFAAKTDQGRTPTSPQACHGKNAHGHGARARGGVGVAGLVCPLLGPLI